MPYKNKSERKLHDANAIAYENSPEQVKKREARNRARAKLLREGKVHKGDGKDVAHKKALDKGGSNKDGVFVQKAGANRSFNRDSKGNLLSEISPNERKKGLRQPKKVVK
jgi:hypothetical protein